MVSSEFFHSLCSEISKILVPIFFIILFYINPNSVFVGFINLASLFIFGSVVYDL